MTAEFAPKTVRVNGTTLTYVEQGQGEAVVFVHGGNNDFRTWALQLAPFAQHYRAIAYSRRYHYPNPGAEQATEYAASEHADDLAALIETLGIGPAHVVGHSYGGYLSLLVARARPALVRSLALGEPGALSFLGPEFVRAHLERTIGPAREAFERGEPEQAVRVFMNTVAGEGAFDRLPPPARQVLLDNGPEFRLEVNTPVDHYFTTFDCDEARQIHAPTLLLTGEVSPVFLHQIVDELARCLPNVERAMIPRASHGMHNMNPQAYNDTVLAFLAKH
jgi:non-heme chloroperoxidase